MQSVPSREAVALRFVKLTTRPFFEPILILAFLSFTPSFLFLTLFPIIFYE